MRKLTLNSKITLALLTSFLSLTISAQNVFSGTANNQLPEVADPHVIIPSAWAFGVLYGGYTNQEETIETIKRIQAHDYPIDAYWIDSWFWSYEDKGKGPKKYIDFVADTILYPDREAMWGFMQQNNIKGGFWIWNCILQTGNEEAFTEFDSLGYFSKIYYETSTWHNHSTSTAMFQEGDGKKGTLCGDIDFKNPDAVRHFKQRMKHFFDEGADFIKLDRTTAIETVRTIFEMSQEFGRETQGRGFTLSHAGSPQGDEYKHYPAKWTSDTRSDWTVENPLKDFDSWVPRIAFKENIRLFTDTSKNSSKIPFLTNDTGGFDMGKTDRVDEELYIRWVQFSAFNPIMEVFSQPENISGNLAFNYSAKADEVFKKYSHLRMELFPYIYSYALASRLEGENIIRPIKGFLYQYYFGKEFLVAPVYEQGASSVKVYFPEGTWVDFWSGEEIHGGQNLDVKAPIEQLPLFVKKGSLIPMRPYASSIETGTRDKIILHVFPGKDGKFSLLEDDGKSNEYLNGTYAVTDIEMTMRNKKSFIMKIHPAKGSYKGMPQQRRWQIVIHSGVDYKKGYVAGKKLSLERTPDDFLISGEMNCSAQDGMEMVFK